MRMLAMHECEMIIFNQLMKKMAKKNFEIKAFCKKLKKNCTQGSGHFNEVGRTIIFRFVLVVLPKVKLWTS